MESQAKDHTAHADMSPGFHVIDGFDPYSIRIPIAREHGISSAIVKPVGGMISGQGFSVDLRSSMASIEDSQSYLFAQINHRNGNRGTFWLKIREAFEDAELYSQQMSFLKMRPMSTHLSLSPIHLEALVRVMKAEMPLVLEAHRLSDILGALRFRKEMHDKGYKIELILAGAEESWLASKQLAAAQVPVIITPTQQMPRTLNQLRVRDDLATLLQEAGVPFVISTNDMNVRRLRQQAGRAVAYGLPYENALKSITADAARYFKLDDRGSLSVGLRADLVVWSGDPLEPQSYVEALWIAGQLQQPGHRQRQLARSYLDAPVSH
ncbi:amidohydrolase family protein [Pseudobacteriovorax antillogorgiicola]